MVLKDFAILNRPANGQNSQDRARNEEQNQPRRPRATGGQSATHRQARLERAAHMTTVISSVLARAGWDLQAQVHEEFDFALGGILVHDRAVHPASESSWSCHGLSESSRWPLSSRSCLTECRRQCSSDSGPGRRPPVSEEKALPTWAASNSIAQCSDRLIPYGQNMMPMHQVIAGLDGRVQPSQLIIDSLVAIGRW